MTASNIILAVLIALVLYIVAKRFLAARSIKQYSSHEAKEKLRNNNYVFLDVRTKAERSGKKISGSIHIPINELHGRSEELNKFKQKEIICYCRSGNRSLSAAVMLKKKGFNIANLKGGMIGWN